MNLPQITERDFSSVANLMDQTFSSTFSEWRTLCAQWEREYANCNIRWVRIHPSALALHLDNIHTPRNLNELLKFADEL